MVNISPSMIAMILGGLLTGLFGLMASLHKSDRPPRWLSLSSFFAGIVVLISGVWSGIEQERATVAIRTQGHDIAVLAARNVDLTSQLTSWTTGSDGFCYYDYGNYADSPGNKVMRVLVHVGNYPIYDVSCKVVDATALRILANQGAVTMESLSGLQRSTSLGTIHPNDIAQNMFSKSHHYQGDFELVPISSESERQEYSIAFSARNGMWYQDVILERVNGRVLTAYRVRRADSRKIIFDHVDTGFPRKEDGTVEWEKPTTPPTLPAARSGPPAGEG